MFESKKSRSLAVGVVGLAVVAAGAGVAVAVADNVKAPYAQAGAVVEASGAIRNAKGVDEVRRTGLGEYCVVFTDAQTDVSRTLTTASSLSRGRIVSWTWSGGCVARRSAAVSVTNTDGEPADAWFSIVIH
ncbi:hypothetical protein ACIRBY_32040 [Streptomyces sp. NPDC096136]|uniref:hypothetical protein n=1 Tax=Streptomyces sp. NPDC096136 TaxID=3366076 RepID=UPI003817037F